MPSYSLGYSLSGLEVLLHRELHSHPSTSFCFLDFFLLPATQVYMNVHSFVTSVETQFPQVRQVSMTYNGRVRSVTPYAVLDTAQVLTFSLFTFSLFTSSLYTVHCSLFTVHCSLVNTLLYLDVSLFPRVYFTDALASWCGARWTSTTLG